MLSNYASKSCQQHYLVTAAKFYIFDLRKPTITSESTQISKTLPITILHSAPSSKIVPRPPELSATFGGRVITILKPSDPKVREYLSNTNLTTCRPPANVVSVPLTFTDWEIRKLPQKFQCLNFCHQCHSNPAAKVTSLNLPHFRQETLEGA